MNNIIKIILLPIIFTFYTFGSDYYISNSGSDSNSGTSISSPWKTISKVNSILLKPGDRISFRRGNIWKEKLNISYSGTSNNPIYIGAYGTGENPVFDGNNEFQYLISLKTDVSYITIDGLFLKNCDPQYSGGARGIIYSNSNNHNLIIKNCYFRQDKISTSSSYAVIYGKDPSYVLIDSCDFSGGSIMVYFRSNNSNHRDVHHIVVTNNYFHEINARLNTGSQYDGQFGIGIKLTMNFLDGIGEVLGSEGIVRDVNITDNRFYKLSGDAIYHEDTRNTRLTTTDFPAGVPIWLVAGRTSYNINIERNWAKLVEWCFVDWGRITDRGGLFPWSNCSYNTIDSCGFDFDGNPTTRYPTNAINTHAWKQVYIENNTISNVATNSGDGKGIILDFSCNSQLFICDSTIVRNNIVSGTGVNSKLNFASAIMLSSAIRCSVYNNICFDNKAGIAIARPTCFDNLVFNNTLDNNDYGFWYGCKTTGNVIKNNAITNNKYFGINNNTNLIYDYNGFYNNGKDYSYGTPGKNDVISDPHYFDAIHHNYRLDSTSAYIGKGADMGLTFDIINSPRKNNIDIGAFQFNQSSNSNLGVNVKTKIFLQGPYKDGLMSTKSCKEGFIPFNDPYFHSLTIQSFPDSIVDWICIELRSSISSDSKVAEKAALLKCNGIAVDVDGHNPVYFDTVVPGNYYIIIRHRNHLSIMSSTAIYISSNTLLYDFTADSASAYGIDALAKLSNGVYGMYSGDGDGNGIININDYNSVSNDIFNSGYNSGDLDLNSIVNVLDYSKSSNNLFKSSKVPN